MYVGPDLIQLLLARLVPLTGSHQLPPPKLGQQLIPSLRYADNIALLNVSGIGLQNLLTSLHQYCSTNELFVSLEKIKVVIFGKKDNQEKDMALWGSQVGRSGNYKYPGVCLLDRWSHRLHFNTLKARAASQISALQFLATTLQSPTWQPLLTAIKARFLLMLAYSLEIFHRKCASFLNIAQRCLLSHFPTTTKHHIISNQARICPPGSRTGTRGFFSQICIAGEASTLKFIKNLGAY